MLEAVKTSLRVNGMDLDEEIQDLIEAAETDLVLSGVMKERIVETDPLIKRAVIIYCKAHFGYEDVKISERFEQAYINLKQHLTLSQEYLVGDDDEGL